MTFTPVLPERTALTFLNSTSEHQASGMIIQAACPTCLMGIVCHGDAICPRCEHEADGVWTIAAAALAEAL